MRRGFQSNVGNPPRTVKHPPWLRSLDFPKALSPPVAAKSRFRGLTTVAIPESPPTQQSLMQPDRPSSPLPDMQSRFDSRNVAIDRVGVKGIRYPITFESTEGGRVADPQATVASINMYVALPSEQKGTHMSRFLEVLNDHHESLSWDNLTDVCRSMKDRLKADTVRLELGFPYFIDKPAPVTGHSGKLDIEVNVEIQSSQADDFVLGIKVPATSLSPSSKELMTREPSTKLANAKSPAGAAHNQRCEMTVRVRQANDRPLGIDELFAIVEKCASTQVFPILKRPDEKWVTERAYENPKFVEDIVRELAGALNADPRVIWFECCAESYASIHNHNAFAFLANDKRAKL